MAALSCITFTLSCLFWGTNCIEMSSALYYRNAINRRLQHNQVQQPQVQPLARPPFAATRMYALRS